MTSLAFAWPGLPDYAARCIRAVIDRSATPVTVIATPPSVPIEGMEQSLGQPVNWVEGDDTTVNWQALGVERPDLLFTGGYGFPAFNALADEVRNAGGRVVLMSDNNWTGTPRQRVLDPLRHRLLLRHRHDAIFVPGASGVRVARSWGYPQETIQTGLYGADPTLFNGGPPLEDRPKTFLFVGQFIARKNVLGLVDAFARFAARRSDWSLRLCGSGPQNDQISKVPGLSVHGFVQPPQLAELLRGARCLVLPSLEEHWGLVVHEAALSGCALALTRTVGAASDLARPQNALLFAPGDTAALADALAQFAAWDDDRWATAERTSRQLAAAFGPAAFADGVLTLATKLGQRQHA